MEKIDFLSLKKDYDLYFVLSCLKDIPNEFKSNYFWHYNLENLPLYDDWIDPLVIYYDEDHNLKNGSETNTFYICLCIEKENLQNIIDFADKCYSCRIFE